MPIPDKAATISPAARWGRLAMGVCLLGAMFGFFASGYTPPGICGEVIRHNQQAVIDASPFFYGDVENMLELIEAAEIMTAAKAVRP